MTGVDLTRAHLEGIEWKEGTWNWACGVVGDRREGRYSIGSWSEGKEKEG
jgi:hypothetical protein